MNKANAPDPWGTEGGRPSQHLDNRWIGERGHHGGGEHAHPESVLRLWREESAQDLAEYALLLVLVALAAVTSMGTLASTIVNVFTSASTNLSTTTT